VQNPLRWAPFWPNLKAALKPRFGDFKVGREMKVCFAPLVIIECVLFKIGAPQAWLGRWKTILFLLALAAVLEVVAACGIRVVGALWEVCRKERFREVSWVVIYTLVITAIFSGYLWHYSYVRAPHFELTVSGRWMISNVYDYPGATPV
jgi:hypothetical protein